MKVRWRWCTGLGPLYIFHVPCLDAAQPAVKVKVGCWLAAEDSSKLRNTSFVTLALLMGYFVAWFLVPRHHIIYNTLGRNVTMPCFTVTIPLSIIALTISLEEVGIYPLLAVAPLSSSIFLGGCGGQDRPCQSPSFLYDHFSGRGSRLFTPIM
jgi:hypothetical protein